MRHSPHRPPLEARIQLAWPAPLATAGQTPDLRPALVRRQPARSPV
jgi:hypothetical protein